MATRSSALHQIKWNGTAYLQDCSGAVIEQAIYLRDLMRGTDAHYRAARLNIIDPVFTCNYCSTTYRLSDQREADRCPFCFRLIPLPEA